MTTAMMTTSSSSPTNAPGLRAYCTSLGLPQAFGGYGEPGKSVFSARLIMAMSLAPEAF